MKNQQTYRTDYLELTLSASGRLEKIIDSESGRNYIPGGKPAPLISVRMDGQMMDPKVVIPIGDSILSVDFGAGVEVKVKVVAKRTHVRIEVVEAVPFEEIELIVWGPYPNTIDKIIGETVGVVRGNSFALGIQSLNPKTLGGYPWKENDCMPQLDIFENEDYSDLSEEGKRYVLYRVEAAKPEEYGSSLQAYCRNRNSPRVIENWGHELFEAPAFDDGGVVGSAIALFGCPVDSTLSLLGAIEQAEGLPHPMIDGRWAKVSQEASSSYMILGFGEEDIDRALAYTEQAGLKYLYHPGPFESWGHFPFNDQFPNGIDGMQQAVERAESKGIHLGTHFLSNFISTDDLYVSPVPDKRLARVGRVVLSGPIDENQTEIGIESPELFRSGSAIKLRTLMIGNELIQYETISQEEPWQLQGCTRGAFGTPAEAHDADQPAALLADHAYQVFLSNADLTREIAETMARLYNETGLRQISFDGLEGNRSTGLGNYGEILMTTAWYDNLNDNIRAHYIADASRTSHFFWHIYTRMNWGEPWYAGFRESQTDYRFKNQKYFQRNLMPGMLGWFLMTEETTIEDIEWMLAKAAGYNAGFGFVSNYQTFERNGFTDTILKQIRTWETARMEKVFDEDLQKQLIDVDKEFHLEEAGDGGWDLTEIHTFKTEHNNRARQPGEPTPTRIEFENPAEDVPLVFSITALEQPTQDVWIRIDNNAAIELPGELQPGESYRYAGGSVIIQYNKNHDRVKEWPVKPFMILPGMHSLEVDCGRMDGIESKLKLEVRMAGDQWKIKGKINEEDNT